MEQTETNVKIMPLGGVRENGKNMYLADINDAIYVLDCGLQYPENELLGIDIVIPNYDYLEENADRIVGVFLTHGHADAIGGLPYFLKDFAVPVFGSQLTIELAKLNVQSDPNVKGFDDFHVVDANTEIDFGDVTASFFKTTHTVPESFGVVLKTTAGSIVYTGDFKFDQTAVHGFQTDYARLAEIGKSGVLALLSDSANAENPNKTATERDINDYVQETFNYHDGRIVVASVGSNILRMQQVFNAAAKTHRKILLTGRDIEKIVATALKLNKLVLPEDDLLIELDQLAKLEPEQVVIVQTGKMGEPMKALQRMANKQEKNPAIQPGDLVFITTTPSHAMETTVARTRDLIYRAGAEVKSISDELNSSGHASKTDLQLMLNLLHPQYLIPVQGEYRLLAAHRQAAKEVGMQDDQIFLTKKGDQLVYDGQSMFLSGSVEVGNTMIDGIGVGDIGNIVLRDRKVLSEDGIFVAVVTIDRKKKKIISDPKITSRGFVYVKANKDLMRDSAAIVTKAVQDNLDNKEFDWTTLKQDVREKLNRYLFEQTRRHPVILPVIMEVDPRRRKPKSKHKKKLNEDAPID